MPGQFSYDDILISNMGFRDQGGLGSFPDPAFSPKAVLKYLPTHYAGLLAWYELPPKSLIASPDKYLTRLQPIVPSPDNLTSTAGWNLSSCTVTAATGGTTNDGHAFNEIVATGAGGIQVDRVMANHVAGRATRMLIDIYTLNQDWVCITDGNSPGPSAAACWFNLTTGTVGTQYHVASASVINQGSYYTLDVTFSTITTSYFDLWMVTGDNTVGVPVAGQTVYATNVRYIQDGVISQLNDLSGNGLHATQSTFTDSLYYMGELEANWSTGAPSLENPGTSTALFMNFPAALAGLMSGDNQAYELLAFTKWFGVPTAAARIIQLSKASGASMVGHQINATGVRNYTRRNDALVTQNFNWSSPSIVGEELTSENADGVQIEQYYGATAVADASSPVAVTNPGVFTYDTINGFLYAAADGLGRHAVRSLAIFDRKLTPGERVNILQGFNQRAQ